jgi:ferredoxin--NADP+ reductase
VFRILEKRSVGPGIQEYLIEAPDVARTAKAGQFIVLRLHEHGERIPLTIVEALPETGGIRLVVQEVGKTTQEMGAHFDVGDSILDFVGPLGEPSEIDNYGTVLCVGGGVGIAPLLPITRALHEAGNHVIGIIGARNAELMFYEDEMTAACDELHVMTDDGSHGRRGFVSQPLEEILASGAPVARVWVIGPPIMMKVCAEVTRPYGVPTIVSLNPIMIDGTGMCGGCRVEVNGVARFACVDGPEFDAHAVNFDQLMARLRYFSDSESEAVEHHADCLCRSEAGSST